MKFVVLQFILRADDFFNLITHYTVSDYMENTS